MARRDRAASDRRAFLTRGRGSAAVAPGLVAPVAPAVAPIVAPAIAPELQLVQSELGLATEAAEAWIALHLPTLVLESLTHRAAPPAAAAAPAVAAPLAIFEPGGSMPRLVAVDAAARARGVVPGLTLAAALALAPALDARPRQPRRERALLAQLAEACFAFTPRVSLEPPDGLLLEVRGSLGLFGGAAALCEAVQARCGALGLGARLALAPTPLAALALARAGRTLAITGSERLVGALATLPLALLRWPPPALARPVGVAARLCTRRPCRGSSALSRPRQPTRTHP